MVRSKFDPLSIDEVEMLLEAAEVLKRIIYASDDCQGHRDCEHSMEPWQRARQLLPKLDAVGLVDF